MIISNPVIILQRYDDNTNVYEFCYLIQVEGQDLMVIKVNRGYSACVISWLVVSSTVLITHSPTFNPCWVPFSLASR